MIQHSSHDEGILPECDRNFIAAHPEILIIEEG